MLMKNKKKPILIAAICVAVLAAAAACVWFFWLKDYLGAANASPVYVNSVSAIVGFDTGANPRYSGIVEPQKTTKVQKDESKTVAEILVEPGNEVHVGDTLFRYDTQEMQFDLDQAELDLQGIANQISTLKKNKSNLEAEKKKASKDDQYAYTVQIQAVDLEIKQQEYNSSLKKSEINKLKKSLENAEVLSEVDGVVKEVNQTPKTDATGQQLPFISILSSGEYRIKGTVSELNLSSLTEGQAVTVHSRMNSDAVWKGTVESIDLEPSSDQNNGMMYYGGMDSGDKSSQYNFYVTLESLDGLILGQHVYIEPDQGESTKKTGLWLPAVYVDHDDSGSFVWARNEKEKLEKRTIILGEYDSDNDMYEIKSGISTVDYIAYPGETLREGMPTTVDASAQPPADGGQLGGDGAFPGGDGAVNGMDIPADGAGGDAAFPEGDNFDQLPADSGADGDFSSVPEEDGAGSSGMEEPAL